jgi:PAS domain S-box-containing protein
MLRRAEITEPYGYILKPFQEMDLRVTIEMALYSHRLKRELRESEARYRDLFDNSPVPLWEEDFCAVKAFIENRRQQGVSDFERYFDDHPEDVVHCVSLVKVEFESKEQAQRDFSEVFGPETTGAFKKELVAIAEGRHTFERETAHRTRRGEILDLWVKWSVTPGCEEDLSRVIVSVIDITQRKRAQEAAERKGRDQELLLETAQYLTASLDVTEVLTRIGGGAREILDATGCGIYLLEADGETLTPVIVVDPEHEEAVRSASLSVETSLTGQAVTARRGLIFNEAGTDPSGYQIPGTAVELEERVIAAPFVIDGEVLGAMCLNRIGRDFSEEDLVLAESFAAYSSSALRNAQAHRRLELEMEERKQVEAERERLLETEHEQRVLAEALRRAVAALSTTLEYEGVLDLILEQVALVLPCDAADIMLVEEGQSRVFRWRGYGQLGGEEFVSSWVFRTDDVANLRKMRDTRQPLAIPDVANCDEWVPTPETGWIASYIGAPICLRDRVIGFLNVNSKTPNFYCQADAERLQAFADHAAVAIENARLYEQVRNELAERRRAEEALGESEERLRLLIESAEDIVIMQDLEGKYLYYNGPSRYGLEPGDVVGKTPFDFHAPAAATEYVERIRKVAESGEGVTSESQVNLQGETYWFMDQSYPIRDSAGNVMAVATISRNITERKRAEKQIRASLREKEVLLQEIHHRVKNNLNVIASLLDLQADTVQDPVALRAFADSRRRIRSMALIHEKLYRSPDLASIGADEYVQEVVDYLAGAYAGGGQPVTLKVQVEDVPLDIDTAIPCGLIINELVANALAHAFPGDGAKAEPSEVTVDLRADDGRYLLTVSDNGVGLPPDLDFRNTQSLGLQLVNLLTEQLQGTITLDRSGGTSFTIAFGEQTGTDR